MNFHNLVDFGARYYMIIKENLQSNDPSFTLEQKSLDSLNLDYKSFIFGTIPRQFTIITNNNIQHKFNIALLNNVSNFLSDLFHQSPDFFEFHLDIDDKYDVLGKFDRMFQGKSVFFSENEMDTLRKIISTLEIDCCTPELSSNKDPNSKFCLNIPFFLHYFKIQTSYTFKITTKKNEYKCNVFGVYSSKVILDLVTQDPTIDHYYYDFDDEFNEFQPISNLFNFDEVKITKTNMYSLKEIIDQLKITMLVDKINKFIEKAEKVSEVIDDQQTIIDTNEELFSWLYQIKENNVDTTTNFIINSDWIQTEEKVQEFVAFILQVIKTDSTYHPFIADLIVQLHKMSSEKNSLYVLIPFLLKKLNDCFGSDLITCSFVFNLYKKQIISKEKLIDMIIKVTVNEMNIKGIESNTLNLKKNQLPHLPKIKNIALWFYPELIENKEFEKQTKIAIDTFASQLWYKYFPHNVDDYIKMRDSGEPDDEITKALRCDDIDAFQSLIIKNDLFLTENDSKNDNSYSTAKQNISNAFIAFNLYEDFINNGGTTYINYACAYGSVKCFKYLLLNHAKVDISTFRNAVFGGNIEIIKIVDQTLQKNDINDVFLDKYSNKHIGPIIPAIMKHQNDIFDWIFQEKYINKEFNNTIKTDILLCAAKNGNAHALIEIIDSGVDFISELNDILREISMNGYCLLTKLFFKIFQKAKDKNIFLDYSYLSFYGNLSIFKVGIENIQYEYELNALLCTAVLNDCRKILQYFIQNVKCDDLKKAKENIFTCLFHSIPKETNELFNYLFQHFIIKYPKIFDEFDKFEQLLSIACSLEKVEISKKLIDLASASKSIEDFTIAFYNAAISNQIEICKYLIENKLIINYEKLSTQVSKLALINEEIFSLIVENADIETKEMFLNTNYLEQAIAYKNKSLVQYFLKENVFSNNSLYLAVNTDDIELVDIILKYNSRPSFINRVFKNGTALCNAVVIENIKIIKRLLSIPGIDLSLYDQNQKTPLHIALEKVNVEISDEILNFYHKNNQSPEDQLNKSIKILLKSLVRENRKSLDKYMFFVSENFQSIKKDKKDMIYILKRIIEFKEINPNMFVDNYTILLYACKYNELDLVEILLRNEKTNTNLYSPVNGNTPLILSLENNNFEIAKMLIEHPKTNLNIRNFEGQTALTLSVVINNEVIVDLLINNERFDPEESYINKAFFYSFGRISEKLISFNSLDINYILLNEKDINNLDSIPNKTNMKFNLDENSVFNSCLLDSIENCCFEKVDLIINHPSFNKTKSQLKRSIFAVVKQRNLEIFKKLIKLINNDINICDSNKQYLFNFAVENRSTEIAKEILINPNLDPNKCDILAAFIYYVKNNNEDSIYMMKEIYNYDKEHLKVIDFDHLLPTGESFFTLIASKQFIDYNYLSLVINSSYSDQIAAFFIEHGVDPNAPDKNGFYPLEYAILLESESFVRVLLNTNQINYSQIIEMKSDTIKICDHQLENSLGPSAAQKKTYLHIAARSKNLEVLKELINKNCIDINSTDELGETPLFEACRFNRFNNIRLLTKIDTVNINHLNNNGDDILKISMNLLNIMQEKEINSRDDYINALISIFSEIDYSTKFDDVD